MTDFIIFHFDANQNVLSHGHHTNLFMLAIALLEGHPLSSLKFLILLYILK